MSQKILGPKITGTKISAKKDTKRVKKFFKPKKKTLKRRKMFDRQI